MTDPWLHWSFLESRSSSAELNGFTCTSELPRSPGGRKLPHPKPWEWQAQALLRNAKAHFREGHKIVVGREGAADGPIAAAAWLQFHHDVLPAAFMAAGAVDIALRGKGGATADELVARTIRAAVRNLEHTGTDRILVHGNVHTHNSASTELLTRNGFDPVGVPTGEFQQWARIIDPAHV